MTRSEAGKLGAIATAKVIRKISLDRYYKNPVVCKNCDEIIHPRVNERPSVTKQKNFCNHSCAAIYNNKNYSKRYAKTKIGSLGHCVRCNKEIKYTSSYKKKFCDNCYKIDISERFSLVKNLTKKELRERSKHYSSFKANVAAHAYDTYEKSGKPKVCACCGYSLSVEICHIKDVKDFKDNALMEEINHKDNLIALCRNHHWEFNHNYIKLPA